MPDERGGGHGRPARRTQPGALSTLGRSRVLVEMWQCSGTDRHRYCRHLNFLSRGRCQACEAPARRDAPRVEQAWLVAALPPAFEQPPAAPFVGVSHRPAGIRRPGRDEGGRVRERGGPVRRQLSRGRRPPPRQQRVGNDDLLLRSPSGLELDDFDDDPTELDGGGTESEGGDWAAVARRGHEREQRRAERKRQRQHRQHHQQGHQRQPRQHQGGREAHGTEHTARQRDGGANVAQRLGADGDQDTAGAADDDGEEVPRPYAPPPYPRVLLANRYKVLEKKVEELEKGGEAAEAIALVASQRDEVRQMLKAAGGATESKLHHTARDEWRKLGRYDKAISAAEVSLEAAKRAAEEAERAVLRTARKLEAVKQKKKNASDKYAWLATNLAAEANSGKQPAAHLALQRIREAVGNASPEMANWLCDLESFVVSVAPAANEAIDESHVLPASVAPPRGACDAASDGTSIASDDEDFEVGDLILQPNIEAAERDLRDLIKQREQAVALAFRTDGSQREAAQAFNDKICAAQLRLDRTKAMLRGASASASAAAPRPAASGSTFLPSQERGAVSDAMVLENGQRKRPVSETRGGDGMVDAAAQSARPVPPMALPAAFATADRAASVPRAPLPAVSFGGRVPLAFQTITREGARLRSDLQSMVRAAELNRPTRGRSPHAAAGRECGESGAGRSRSERQ